MLQEEGIVCYLSQSGWCHQCVTRELSWPHNTPDMSVTPDDPLVSMMTRPISVLKLVPDHLRTVMVT